MVSAAAGVGALLFWPHLSRPVLVVEDARRGHELLKKKVLPGDQLTLSYLHSVSNTRVKGIFEISADGMLVVRETSFGTFGPGLPALKPGDRYEIRDGAIHQLDLDQRLPELSVFVHPNTEHVLHLSGEIGQVLELSKLLPAGSLVRISVRPGR